MKYTPIMIILAILAAIVIGDGYRHSRRASQKTQSLQASVSAMSIQQLAQSSQECDSASSPGEPTKHSAAYCAEVWRAIEDQPLQAVEMRRSPHERSAATD